MFSPKIEIINHFDKLIQQIDIECEIRLEQYKEYQVLGELLFLQIQNRDIEKDYRTKLDYGQIRQKKSTT